MNHEPMHVMSREAFERLAAREVDAGHVADALVYTEEIAGRTVTFNRMAPLPETREERMARERQNPATRHRTVAGIGNRKVRAP